MAQHPTEAPTKKKPTHWADINAQKIVGRRGARGADQPYTCASGITPSGTVHVGNFREIISVDLVVRALRDRGEAVRFIYSWDEYDVFRKVPANMPNQEMLQKHLRWPITLVPDPYGRAGSYARANEAELETLLSYLGIHPEYIYQAARYRSSAYAEGIKTALENRDKIRSILNEYRTTPLPDDWWPVSVFSNEDNTDRTEVLDWDGGYMLTYKTLSSGSVETVDLRTTPAVKLPWRIDWPMRWAEEGVDFEPAGKDHHSEGGSFDTGRRIAKEVYGIEPPVTFQYDFVRIKGGGGKISSSSGDVVSLRDVLEIYQPEVVRYLFAGTRPNSEFAVSFDLDVIKIYEDYDKCERIYFGTEEVGAKRRDKESRIYELSQVDAPPETAPLQIGFRHLCNLLQIADGDVEKALDFVPEYPSADSLSQARLRERAKCAWNWITELAPEDFRFQLRDSAAGASASDLTPVDLSEQERRAVVALRGEIEENFESHDERSLSAAIYQIAEEQGIEPKAVFQAMYRVLIGQSRGPRLAGFILTIGKDRVLSLLRSY
jgi:lysyl-tRNA synthetase class 1